MQPLRRRRVQPITIGKEALRRTAGGKSIDIDTKCGLKVEITRDNVLCMPSALGRSLDYAESSTLTSADTLESAIREGNDQCCNRGLEILMAKSDLNVI
jgi:hypothetical protein